MNSIILKVKMIINLILVLLLSNSCNSQKAGVNLEIPAELKSYVRDIIAENIDGGKVDLAVEHIVLKSVSRNSLFPNLFATHFTAFDFYSESDHITKLIRLIYTYYIKIRLFEYGKMMHQQAVFDNLKGCSRQQSNKLILFRGL